MDYNAPYFDVIANYLSFAMASGNTSQDITKGIMERLKDSRSFRAEMAALLKQSEE